MPLCSVFADDSVDPSFLCIWTDVHCIHSSFYSPFSCGLPLRLSGIEIIIRAGVSYLLSYGHVAMLPMYILSLLARCFVGLYYFNSCFVLRTDLNEHNNVSRKNVYLTYLQ